MLRIMTIAMIGLALTFATPATAADLGTPEEAKALAERAATAYESLGREDAFIASNDKTGEFVDRDLYVFVLDQEGTVLAHGANEKLIGKSLLNIKDVNGVLFVQDMVETAKSQGTGWVNYSWTHPITKKIAPKTSYLISRGNVIIGVGAYK